MYVTSDIYPLRSFNISAGKSLYQRESVSKTTNTAINIAITEKLHLFANVELSMALALCQCWIN